MKTCTIVALLPILASAAILPRQHDHMNMGGAAPAAAAPKALGGELAAFAQMFTGGFPAKKAFKIEEMTPRLSRPGIKRVKIIYGPFKLHAADSSEKTGNMPSLDRYGTSYQYMVDDDFPRDITILNGVSAIVDEDFKRSDIADGIYNHHNILMNLNRGAPPIVDCGGKKMASPLGSFGLKRDAPAFKFPAIPVSLVLGGATEIGEVYYTTPDGSFNSGYYIGPKDKMSFGLDVVNYNNRTRNVYVQSEIEYVPGAVPGAGAANGQVIGLGMCNGLNPIDIKIPEGQTKWTLDGGNDITVTRDGTFIGMSGHLHDGGVEIKAFINGKEVCSSKAEYGGEGHVGVSVNGEKWETIRRMTSCSDPIVVKRGDKIGLKAFYDTGLHPAREMEHGEMAEQMALLGSTFVPAA